MVGNNWGLAGHEWAVAALRQAIAYDRVPHAIVFAGPVGVGKRTLARTLAQALQCTAADAAVRPCGECRACRQIAAGAYPDVRVIEPERAAGSDRRDRRDISIDQIRALQHQVSLKPYQGPWVVGIVADAHQMSDAAANCLLKTLEEPQARAVLILTAPDVNGLLPTIVSRCQVFPLRPLSFSRSEAYLMRDMAMAPERAALLARLSGGRIGWARRAAQDDALLSWRAQRLDTLQQMLAAGRRRRLDQAGVMSEEFGRGQDGRDAVYDTLELWSSWWRDVLLVQEGCAALLTNIDRRDELHSAAAAYGPAQVVQALSELTATRSYLERNVNPRLALDMLLLALPRGPQPARDNI